MKKKSAGKVILKIFLGFIIAVIVAVIAAYAVIKYYVVPKYTEKLSKSGREEIAELIEGNANLSTVPVLGSILSNKQVMEFIKGIDGTSARSLLGVLDILNSEALEEEKNAESSGGALEGWQVNDFLMENREDSAKIEAEENKNAEAVDGNAGNEQGQAVPGGERGKSAYERIASAATAEEMADGLAIISKLDVSYIVSLAADGLTVPEKQEILRYIRTILTQPEISRALELYRKYEHYLY